jgi:hypothetical protein
MENSGEIRDALDILTKKVNETSRQLDIFRSGILDKQRQLEIRIAEVREQMIDMTIEAVMKRLSEQDLLKKQTPVIEEFDECLYQIDGIFSQAFRKFIADVGSYKIRFLAYLEELLGNDRDVFLIPIPTRVQQRSQRSLEKLRHICKNVVYYERSVDPSNIAFKEYQRWVDLLSELVFWQECRMKEYGFEVPGCDERVIPTPEESRNKEGMEENKVK